MTELSFRQTAAARRLSEVVRSGELGDIFAVNLVAPPDRWVGRSAVEWAERLARGDRFDPQALQLGPLASLIDRIYAAA